MRIGREIELQCPRCRVVAVRANSRQERCTHCGARLVASRSPSEDIVRAYLYGRDEGHPGQEPEREVSDALAGPA